MSATIYARIPESTKAATEAYAATRELSLAGALTQLLARGLKAVDEADAVSTTQTRIDHLERKLRDANATINREVARRELAEHELATLHQAAEAWSQRAQTTVGSCSSCKSPLSGADLMVAGRCAKCSSSTAELVEPNSPNINGRELMLVLGAVGVVLGILAVANNAK